MVAGTSGGKWLKCFKSRVFSGGGLTNWSTLEFGAKIQG